MGYSLFHVERRDPVTLQAQIREMLVSAMLSGQFPADASVPSTRAMARRLKVSRNTVTLAYQALAADGYLLSRERSGFYVAEDVSPDAAMPAGGAALVGGRIDWQGRLALRPGAQVNIEKPADWHDQPYPFIYGQADAGQFPIAAWRDCMRQAMSRQWMDAWTEDRFSADDPMLVEQIRRRILTRRGILARPEEVLVTMGAQHALYLLARLLVRPGDRVAMEDPGYPDFRNILRLQGVEPAAVPVDAEGLDPARIGAAGLVYVTPSHQFPTSVTMSLARRRALLAWAEARDALVIEDDYEYETNYRGEAVPALKSLDRSGRVLHVGSLSKSLMPGLRMGFLVAPAELIAEARALRRLVLRHPPGNNQRVTALFLAQGHHDALISRLHRAYFPRWQRMAAALGRHFPGWTLAPGFGGTAYWLCGPEGLDAGRLARRALKEGVVIEPGEVCFAAPEANRNTFRLGFSSIPEERIAPGIARLAAVAAALVPDPAGVGIRS